MVYGRRMFGGCFVSLDIDRVGVVFGSPVALFRAFSSDGRAPASHAGGRGIDTLNVHF